ncbi:hypothetical protein [Caballeronia mineralivorans]|jgi:hypothetical protein|nr:hypothetical protein [Caballeronia mineralivorans]
MRFALLAHTVSNWPPGVDGSNSVFAASTGTLCTVLAINLAERHY